MRYLLSMSSDGFLWIKLGMSCIAIHESMSIGSD